MSLNAKKIAFYDKYVSQLIVDKYGLDEREALRAFLSSKTYVMLLDTELELYKVSPHILFDMWESEKVTGEPRNSQYIRGDEGE